MTRPARRLRRAYPLAALVLTLATATGCALTGSGSSSDAAAGGAPVGAGDVAAGAAGDRVPEASEVTRTSTAVVGGGPYSDWTVTDPYGNPVDPGPLETIVGGGFYSDWTVTDPYGNPVDPGPWETIVGGHGLDGGSSGTTMEALLDLYAMAPPGSLEQAQILAIIESINQQVDVWVSDHADDRDGDGIPDHRDPVV